MVWGQVECYVKLATSKTGINVREICRLLTDWVRAGVVLVTWKTLVIPSRAAQFQWEFKWVRMCVSSWGWMGSKAEFWDFFFLFRHMSSSSTAVVNRTHCSAPVIYIRSHRLSLELSLFTSTFGGFFFFTLTDQKDYTPDKGKDRNTPPAEYQTLKVSIGSHPRGHRGCPPVERHWRFPW